MVDIKGMHFSYAFKEILCEANTIIIVDFKISVCFCKVIFDWACMMNKE